MLAQRDHIRPRPFPFQDSPFYGLFGGLESPFGHSGPDTPIISVDENDSGFTIRTELPGVPEEDLVIQVQDQRVTVAVKENESHSTENPHHRFVGFQRAFRFRTALQADAAEAKLEKGILTIHLPKTASAVPRTLTLTPTS